MSFADGRANPDEIQKVQNSVIEIGVKYWKKVTFKILGDE
jgi:hypothetical protein